MLLLPGDIFLTRGAGWFSKAIRFFTRGLGESRTHVNHAGIVVVGGEPKDCIVVEALSKTERHPLLVQYGPPSRDAIAFFRHRALTEQERTQVAKTAERYVGKKYGYLKVAAHTLDYLLLGAYVFRRLARVENYPICSWLVARAYKEVGKDFGVPYSEAAPDHLWDYCMSHPDEWEMLSPLDPLSNG